MTVLVDPVGHRSKPIPVRLGPSSGMPGFSPGPWYYPRVFILPGDRSHLSEWPLWKRGKKEANREYSGSKQNPGHVLADILNKPEVQNPSAVSTLDRVQSVCSVARPAGGMSLHALCNSLC